MPDTATQDEALKVDYEKGNFHYPEDYQYDAGTGLTEDTIRYISEVKDEDEWVRDFRLKALDIFHKKAMPTNWASKDLEAIDFSKIRYYLSKGQQPSRSWDEVPDDVKQTFERLGIPEQERKFLAGVEAQFDSEAAYSRMKDELEKEGVLFVGSSEGLAKYPEIFRPYFGKVIPSSDNKFAALNSAVFSGGSFIYVPKGVKLKQPLQAYFRINAENFGQFERTLIIADEGAEVTYMEGCTAPQRGGRTRRAQRGQNPVYHRAELVQQCLQSRYEARHGRRGCGGEVDRLQYRFPPDHEISGRRPQRAALAG